MKAEHRHELKTNELAQWLSDLPRWAKQNLRTIIYVAVFLVLLTAYSIYYFYQKKIVTANQQTALTKITTQLPQTKTQILQAQAQGSDISYMLIQQIGDSLDTLAKNTKEDNVAALAYIKEAEVLRTDLHYRLDSPTQQDIEKQIQRASRLYNNALDKSSRNPAMTALAKFGLGLCEEELGNFDQAKQIYTQITENTEFEGTTAVAAAKYRLDFMHNFTEDLFFEPAPKQTPPEQPLLPQVLRMPQTPDSNANILFLEGSTMTPEANQSGE